MGISTYTYVHGRKRSLHMPLSTSVCSAPWHHAKRLVYFTLTPSVKPGWMGPSSGEETEGGRHLSAAQGYVASKQQNRGGAQCALIPRAFPSPVGHGTVLCPLGRWARPGLDSLWGKLMWLSPCSFSRHERFPSSNVIKTNRKRGSWHPELNFTQCTDCTYASGTLIACSWGPRPRKGQSPVGQGSRTVHMVEMSESLINGTARAGLPCGFLPYMDRDSNCRVNNKDGNVPLANGDRASQQRDRSSCFFPERQRLQP